MWPNYREHPKDGEGTVRTGVCLSTPEGGGTPSPSHNTSTGPMSFLGRYPSDWSQILPGGTQVPVGGEIPWPRQGYFSPRWGGGGLSQSQAGGTPVQGRGGVTPTEWYPQPGQDGVPPPARTGWGNPHPQPGQDRVPPSQDRMGYPSPGQRDYPRTGVHPPPPKPGQNGLFLLTRTAERELAMRRSVCFLRSRRRTVLFLFELTFPNCVLLKKNTNLNSDLSHVQ